MKSEIKRKKLKIEYRKNRTRKIAVLLMTPSLIISLVLYFVFVYPKIEITGLVGLGIGLGVLGFTAGFVLLLFPLPNEDNAFLEIIKAYEIVETTSSDLFLCRKAHKHLKKASKLLGKMDIGIGSWYTPTRNAERSFIGAIKTRTQPALLDGKLQLSHLEDIAYAFIDPSVDKLGEVVQMLEQNYEKHEVTERTLTGLLKQFSHSRIGQIIYSLGLGYGSILAICFIYVIFVGQDFFSFAIDNPEIIILGGALFSGVAFWKKD